MKNVLIDFETFYDEECSVSKLGPRAYVEHPDFDAYLVSIVTEDGDEFVGHPKDFDWVCLRGYQPWAHNAQFDWTVFNKIVADGVAEDPFDGTPWLDTASLAAYLHAPRNLDGAARALLGVEMSKGMRSWMKGRTWRNAVEEGKGDALCEYALNDSRVAMQLVQQYADQWPLHERLLATQTIVSGMKGLCLDVKYINRAHDTLLDEIVEVEKQLPWMNDGSKSKPTSPKALAAACRAAEIPVPKSTAVDSIECDRWILEYGDKAPWVGLMQQHRTNNRVLKLLEKLKDRAVDGRFHFSVKYFGAHTGRWSGDGGFNMHNLPREPLGDVDLRRVFIAPKNKVFVIADLAQIEARITLWLAGDEAQLELIREGISVYEAHARKTMGWTGGELKKENPNLYRLAKARVLGLGFQCGVDKFAVTAMKMAGVKLTQLEAAKTVTAYRATNKGIVNLWNVLDRDVRRSVGGTYELELPSGRILSYFNVMMKGGQCVAQPVRGERHSKVYGGLLTENLVQATARDVLGDIVIRLENADYPVSFTVHDEVVVETVKGHLKRIINIVEAPIEWAHGLPIGCEAIEAHQYQK